MANITITINDADLPDVVAALSERGSLPPTNQNARTVLINDIKRLTKAYRRRLGEEAAVAAVPPPADPDVT